MPFDIAYVHAFFINLYRVLRIYIPDNHTLKEFQMGEQLACGHWLCSPADVLIRLQRLKAHPGGLQHGLAIQNSVVNGREHV